MSRAVVGYAEFNIYIEVMQVRIKQTAEALVPYAAAEHGLYLGSRRGIRV